VEEKTLNSAATSSVVREDNVDRSEAEVEKIEREDDNKDGPEHIEDVRSEGRETHRFGSPSAR
jgi:hypothetical protein